MTSVRSLRRRSSGNSLIICLALLCSSCALFQPERQNDQDVTTETSGEAQVRSRVDTMVLTPVPEDEFVPIKERSAYAESERKAQYNVLLSAPFGASRNLPGRYNTRSKRILSFYLGMKYALRQNESNSRIHLDVFDTEGIQLSQEMLDASRLYQEADLFVGPYHSNNLVSLASFAAQKNRIVVSPWNSTPVVSNQPNYIQMRPSLEKHCEKLTHFARSRHANEEILVISSASKRDAQIRRHIQEVHIQAEGGGIIPPLNEFIVSDLNDPLLNDQFLSIWETDSVRGIILPAWSDEAFVVSILSKINFAKGNRTVSVYGLPQWMEMERMDFDILENLEVFVSGTRPLPRKDDKSKAFVQYYFDTYGELPNAEAYYGIDMGNWVSSLLSSQGSLITEGLSAEPIPGVNQQFDFVAKYGQDGESIDYYCNEFITVYAFDEYQFSPVVEGGGR